MTPKQRIARIRRWRRHEVPVCSLVHPYWRHHKLDFGCAHSVLSKRVERRNKADLLFSSELDWLATCATDLEKALEDRRTVESYCASPRRELSVDPFDKTVTINEELSIDPQWFSGNTLDEAFSKAAGWVREHA